MLIIQEKHGIIQEERVVAQPGGDLRVRPSGVQNCGSVSPPTIEIEHSNSCPHHVVTFVTLKAKSCNKINEV